MPGEGRLLDAHYLAADGQERVLNGVRIVDTDEWSVTFEFTERHNRVVLNKARIVKIEDHRAGIIGDRR